MSMASKTEVKSSAFTVLTGRALEPDLSQWRI